MAVKKQEYTKAIIKVHYKNQIYQSIELDLNIIENNELILLLSDYGTEKLTMLKFPTSDLSFMIFNKSQLNEAIIEIELIESAKPKLIKKTKVAIVEKE